MSDSTDDERPDSESELHGNPEDETKAETRAESVRRWKLVTARALEEIRSLIKRSRLSQRKVEKLAGFSSGYLSQLLSRNVDLKVWHVLAILDAIEHNPGDFFFRVYPATRFRALESFQRASRPLSREMDEKLRELYDGGVESLIDMQRRLGRCEQAVSELEAMGYLDGRRGRPTEES
jgi:transcriptional regulator with XRE-family HTH domain